MSTNMESLNRISIEEAREEAGSIRSMVGEKGTGESYAQAHSALVEQQIAEVLKYKDWLQTLNFAVLIIDKLQEVKDKNRTAENKVNQEKSSIRNQSVRLERLHSDEKLLAIEGKKIEEGGNTLDVKLYGDTLLFGLIDAAQEKKEWDIKQSILDKLRQAEEKIRKTVENPITEVTLSPEEVDLIKKALAEAAKQVSAEISQLDESLDEHRQKYESVRSHQNVQSQEITDLTDMLKASIAGLDKKEEAKGAPAYPNGTESTEDQHQAYIKRIGWRQKQVQAVKYGEAPRGEEISRKWALYTEINGQYLLLNERHAFDDVHPQSILINRIPGETLALYSEGMMMRDGDISIQGVINNGILEQTSSETKTAKEKELKPHYREIKSQLD